MKAAAISPPYRALWFGGGWGRRKNRRPEDLAYLLDQALGRLGIPYFMTLEMTPLRREFLVMVSDVHANQVEEVIARLEGRRPVALPPRAAPPDSPGDSAGPALTGLL